MLKCDEKFLWNLLSLSQEGNFKAGRFALIYADELHVASLSLKRKALIK